MASRLGADYPPGQPMRQLTALRPFWLGEPQAVRARIRTMITVVWFKRDLRLIDHRPLAEAARTGAVVPLYIVEPGYWALPDTAARHWEFLAEGLSDLRAGLAARGQPLVVRVGDAVSVFEDLRQAFGGFRLYSHEETGNAWTYDRDRRVKAWARANSVDWREWPQFGVLRGLQDRNGWARRWDQMMAEPMTAAPPSLEPLSGLEPGVIPDAVELGLAVDGCGGRQPGGRLEAEVTLQSFLTERGRGYRREMSSPLTGESACSRLSPHLAAGTLSMREAAQATWARQRAVAADTGRTGWKGALSSFAGRLHWHCHFIQKLETTPELETRCLHPAYEGLRGEDSAKLKAWCDGTTGWPFVDACMAMLRETGWINFRMRAMLMAVASYHLWLDWREPGLHLARLFTDYEPGIHWSQVQMQSGTTGINTPRIYNPIKQSMDQDPDGTFIRRWLPALAAVPAPMIHTPWTLTPLEQADLGVVIGRDYPAPVVDHMVAARHARSKIWSVRSGAEYRDVAAEIQRVHGSRRSGMPMTGARRRANRRDGDKANADQMALEV